MKQKHRLLVVFLTLVLAFALTAPPSFARGRDNKSGTPKQTVDITKDQVKIDIKDIPTEITSAIKSAYPNADIKEAVRLYRVDGTTMYRVKISDNDTDRFLMYTPGGQLTQVEQKVDKDQLPAAVQTTLNREYPNPDIKMVDKVVRSGVTTWDVLLEQNNQRLMVTFDDSGNRLSANPETKGAAGTDWDKDKDKDKDKDRNKDKDNDHDND